MPGQQRPPESDGSPSLFDLSLGDLKPVFTDAAKESFEDNLALVSAGVGFYIFVAIVPLLAAAVMIYGLATDPATVVRQVGALTTVLPHSAADLIGQAMKAVVSQSKNKSGLGLAIAFGLALFWARNGAGGIIAALGMAYEREDNRGILKLTGIALLLTLIALVAGGVIVGAIFVLTFLGSFVPGVGSGSVLLYHIATYVVLLLAGMAAAATLYRYAPDGAEPRWQWVSPGSVFCGVCWVLLTLGFTVYINNWGNYDATYGPLSAVVVLLTWLWLGAYVLLFGAELNWSARERARERPESPHHPEETHMH